MQRWHWNEYLAECNFNIPSNLDDPKIKDDLLIIKNDNRHELEISMKEVLDILEDNVWMKGGVQNGNWQSLRQRRGFGYSG